MNKQDIERLYDTAVRFIFSHGQFDRNLLQKALGIDEGTLRVLLDKMVKNKAISPVDEHGTYSPVKTYIHSEYLLQKELKEDKENSDALKVKKQNKKLILYFFICSVIFFFVTCFFALREPVTLLFIIPSVLLCSWVTEKLHGGLGVLGVLSILVCASSLLWVNSKTPIFGDRYAERIQYDEMKKEAKKQEYAQEKKRVLAEYDAVQSVKKSLKDPESASFSRSKTGNGGASCGYVNAKNSFGVYTGSRRYIVVAGVSVVDDDSQQFNKEWNKFCE